MAEERNKGREERPKTRLDEFIARVVPDPKNPAEAQLLTGFLGASSEPEHTRIYSDASLSSYIDAKTADILHSEPLSKEQSPLGGSYIWLKRDAQVSYGGAGEQSSKGKFFEGPLMTAYGGQFGAAAGAGTAAFGGATILPSHVIVCHPTPFICTVPVYCNPSPFHPCVSHYCTQQIVCWHTPLCPVITPNCPVASPGCPPVGPGTPVQGTPVQGQGAGVAAGAAMPFAIPSLVCSYAAGCWYSWGACPTQGWCGGRPGHPPVVQEAAAAGAPAAMLGAIPSLVCSYGPGCWYSWGACPTQGGCGPHHTPNCPMLEAPFAGPAVYGTGWACGSGYYCPPPRSIASCGHHCTI